MKMFLTRMGYGSCAVVNGDLTQIDLPNNVTSGLSNVLEVLSTTKNIGVIKFESQDVVRHPLVRKIIDAYEAFKNNR
jgi:phosphate starvation-inducible PhoH-like protein